MQWCSWWASVLRRCTDRLYAHQGFDDVHGGTTMPTNEGRLHTIGRKVDRIGLCMIDGRYHMQQLARLGKIVLAFGIGEQTVVPDAMKATGQDMQQEAAQELICF